MKNDLTELVFILDKSGSMAGLESDTIGGYNSVLKKQQAEEGECRITTVLFNDGYTLLHDRIDLRAVRPISDREYQVGGSTALLDAVGRTIHKIVSVQKNTVEDYRADKVMFVIITDGMENSSREYSFQKVREMIEHQKSKYGWEFLFLGANIDAVEAASQIGIGRDRAMDYMADARGLDMTYHALDRVSTAYRRTGEVHASEFSEVLEDAKRRRGK